MSELKCPNCGVVLSAEAQADGWCAECGKRVPPMLLARAAQPASERPRRQWLPWIGFVLLLVTAGVCGWMWSMVKRGELRGPVAAIPVVFSFVLTIASLIAAVVDSTRRNE